MPRSAERERQIEKEIYLEALDEPRHATVYGGINGEATIKGIPNSRGELPEGDRSRKLGLVMESVPVMLRDAVTIDNAVRLTGISRQTLQRACAAGRLPAIKTGPGPAPYLVRIRDIITYMATMWVEHRTRKDSGIGDLYLGFPEWMAREIFESWPDNMPYDPGKWESARVNINKGGRPRGYSPGKGFSVHGVRLGRPLKASLEAAVDEANAAKVLRKLQTLERAKKLAEAQGLPPPVLPETQKAATPEESHPQEPPPVPAPQSDVDPTTLPKWHPLWRRPGT
jgi:hypothetical protein